MTSGIQRFEFAFAAAYRLPGLLFGVTPRTAWVDVAPEELRVRYGPWSLATPRSNIRSVEEVGGFSFLKTAGPAHLSFSDRGVSFTPNGERAVCVRFDSPVKALDPSGRLRHPGATLGVADVPGLIDALRIG